MPRHPLVSRAAVWFYAGDQPYVDLCIKGVQFFIQFNRIMAYSRPTAAIAIDSGTEDGGPPLVVPPWSWWLQFDDADAELHCTNHGIHGYRVEYRDSRSGTSSISVPVTAAEGPRVAAAVETMLRRAWRDVDGRVADAGPHILSVAGLVPRFRVHTWRYDHSLWEGYTPQEHVRRRRGGLEPIVASLQ